MSKSIKNNRVSIYFSTRKDKELIHFISDLEAGDVGYFLKELMRDGMRYRNGVHNINEAPKSVPVKIMPTVFTDKSNNISKSSDMGASFNQLMDMDVNGKAFDMEEAEELFDKL